MFDLDGLVMGCCGYVNCFFMFDMVNMDFFMKIEFVCDDQVFFDYRDDGYFVFCYDVWDCVDFMVNWYLDYINFNVCKVSW